MKEEIQIRYQVNGTIVISYRSIQFKLCPQDYSNMFSLPLKIMKLVERAYEERYNPIWGQRMAVPPPPDEYSKIASRIISFLLKSDNFPIWQVMFA